MVEKVVLVTGAAKRIGAQIAKTLHAEGAFVVIHYRDSADEAEALVSQLNNQRAHSATSYQAELGNVAALQCMVADVITLTGRLDVLVNNASGFYPTPIGEIQEQDWQQLLDSNLKGPLFLSQAAAPYLKKSKGCIVNMVDIHADRPIANHSVYCAAKAGLVMLTKSLATDLGPDVRVNAVAAGAIIWPEAMGSNQSDEIVSRIALKRRGELGDIADTVLFLVNRASYITGQIITVDGGRTVQQ
ncbi:pteridine reductase [Leucothrix arctica]|uniref:Pteridine reductase n=1 Tax=Leucothrix arctica TaxID=1481894 RepID=A0A317CQ66_9GAMM|nr:pteridine reductase [Leucothrix arctica]